MCVSSVSARLVKVHCMAAESTPSAYSASMTYRSRGSPCAAHPAKGNEANRRRRAAARQTIFRIPKNLLFAYRMRGGRAVCRKRQKPSARPNKRQTRPARTNGGRALSVQKAAGAPDSDRDALSAPALRAGAERKKSSPPPTNPKAAPKEGRKRRARRQGQGTRSMPLSDGCANTVSRSPSVHARA